MAARNYSNTAVETTLSGSITNVQTTCTIASDSGWPSVPFIMEIEDELVLVTARTGTSITAMTRGYDNTSNVAHNSGVTCRTVVAATDFDLIWAHVHTASGGDDTAQISHADLSDLTTGDPHTQYLLASGTRSLSGDLNLNNNNVINTPSIAPNSGASFTIKGDAGQNRIVVSANGDITFYDDAGTGTKLQWNEVNNRWQFSDQIYMGNNRILGVWEIQALTNLDLLDDDGDVRFRIGSTGDLDFFADNGSTSTLLWDESDVRWEFANPPYVTSATALVSTVGHSHVESDISNLTHTDSAAIHDNVSSEISAITAKSSPTTSDYLLIEDAAATNSKKRITIGDLPREQTLSFSQSGTLATGTGSFRLPMDYAGTIVSARAMVGTAPTGASLIADINLNGTTIFSTQANRPTIPASSTDSGSDTPNTTSFSAGDYFTVDIDQVGSTIAGADLVVSIVIRPS